MKVLMVSKACYVAAYRRKLEELARIPGVDLTLVVPPYWRFGGRKAALEAGYDQGYRTVVMDPVLNGAHHLHVYPGLARLVRDLSPDLLHVDEEPYDLVTLHALLVTRRAGARLVFFTWQNLLRQFPPPFGWIERHVLRRADGAIAGSEEAALVLRRKGYAGLLAVIPQFGVDQRVFIPAALRPSASSAPVRIGYLGRLVEEKGIRVLLQALREVEGNWGLELVGDGPLRSEVADLVASPGLSGRARLLPSIPSVDVPQYLQGLDVLVLPSLTIPHWKEQFGRVLIEAMACEVAVVGSDSGEIPRVIGHAGLVCREGDVGDLRLALRRLVEDVELRRALGRQGRQRVLDHFTQQRVAEETYRTYQRVLGSGQQGAELQQGSATLDTQARQT